MSLKVKVKGQRSRSLETKTAFSALLAACVRFMFGKTSLASSLSFIKMGHFGDVLSSQFLGVVLKKL